MRLSSALFALSVSAALLPATPLAAAVAGDVRSLNFEVFLDDRAVGYQRFELTRTGDGTRIETLAEFQVKLLLITVFAYEHRNTELWRGDCLQAIDARTDSNGKQYAVSGRARGDAFVVATNEGERSLEECVASFAYWDKEVLLQRQQLLNSQTGEYMSVRIEALGRDRLRIGEAEVAVERYAIKGQALDITLAYALDGGDWVALDSGLEGGRTLSYRRSPDEFGAPFLVQTSGAKGPEADR